MALNLCLNTFNSDCSNAVIKDSTKWGEDGNPLRNTVYLLLIASRVDIDNNFTNLTVTPDNSDPLLVTEWSFPTSDDGHYNFELISATAYQGATLYPLDIIVYHNGLFYKNIQAIQDVAPDEIGGSDYWEVLLEDNFKPEEELSQNSHYIYNAPITCRLQNCLKDMVLKTSELKTNSGDWIEAKKDSDQLLIDVEGIHSLATQHRFQEMEELIGLATKFSDLNCCD